MERDGMCTSLWQYNVPQYQASNTTIPDSSYDVIIVGGGITGVSTALELQKAGKNAYWSKRIHLDLVQQVEPPRI